MIRRAAPSVRVFRVVSVVDLASTGAQLDLIWSGGLVIVITLRKPMRDVKDDGFGSRLQNDYKPVIGRKSAASRCVNVLDDKDIQVFLCRARDDQLLAGLGGGLGSKEREVASVVASGRDTKGRPRGALLTQTQKEVVAVVSRNVSSELGSRLLAPTPGARALLGTMVKERERDEQQTTKHVAMSAKELLASHKYSLAPTLGRGLAKEGGEVGLLLISGTDNHAHISR